VIRTEQANVAKKVSENKTEGKRKFGRPRVRGMEGVETGFHQLKVNKRRQKGYTSAHMTLQQ
jgi:hypothetical protein